MIYTKTISYSYPSGSLMVFPDICCNAGETLLITGKSGSGKTTLLHLLSGLLQPTSGEIKIENQLITTLSTKKMDAFRGNHIGLVLQQNHFIASLTVLDNILVASWLATGKKDAAKALVLLDSLSLLPYKNKIPSHLSIGQQQRVSIARALINEPKLILADEPTSALDDENAFAVAKLLQEVSVKYQAALLIVTHDNRLKDIFPNQISLS